MYYIKTLLIIAVLALIIIIIYNNFSTNNVNEHYYASFDSRYIDPSVNPYSKDITYLPYARTEPVINDPANSDTTKLFTATSDFDKGLDILSDTYDTDPKNRQRFVPDGIGHVTTEYMPNELSDLREVREGMSDIEEDIMNYSEGLEGTFNIEKCEGLGPYEIYYDTAYTDSGAYPSPLTDDGNIEHPYTRSRCRDIDIMNSSDMTLSDDEYKTMLKNMENTKILVKDVSSCPIDEKQREECEKNLKYEDLCNVVKKYRQAAFNTIIDGYTSRSCNIPFDNGVMEYDRAKCGTYKL